MQKALSVSRRGRTGRTLNKQLRAKIEMGCFEKGSFANAIVLERVLLANVLNKSLDLRLPF